MGEPAYEGALVAGIRAAGRPSAPYPPGRRGSAARTTGCMVKTMFFDDSNLAIESMRLAPNPQHAVVALLDSTSGDLVGADAERFTQLTEHAEALRQRQRDQEPHSLSELVRRYRDGDSRLAVEGGSVGMARCPRRCSVRLLRRARAAAIGVAACSRQPVAVDAQRREPGGAREHPRPRAGGAGARGTVHVGDDRHGNRRRICGERIGGAPQSVAGSRLSPRAPRPATAATVPQFTLPAECRPGGSVRVPTTPSSMV